MIVRDIKRLVLVVGLMLLLLFVSVGLWDSGYSFRLRSQVGEFFGKTTPETDSPHHRPGPTPGHDGQETHHRIYSLSTTDKKYFPIKFGTKEAFNPNIIPHPTKDNTYIIVGQKVTEPNDPAFGYFEIGCEAVFINDSLRCLDDEPAVLPVAPTAGTPGSCEKEPGFATMLELNIGPHDARLLYGPTKPYLLFGSNSMFTCFGMWLQEFSALMSWGAEDTTPAKPDDFARATELQRPPPYSGLEKNYFIFWDSDNTAYVHIDTFPTRVMAQLNPDGSVGKDLGPYAAEQDEKCLAHYLPALPPQDESIHQATNSLRVTMCRRADAGCTPDEHNTVLVTIIQHKKWRRLRGEYEPYVVAFRDRSPFELVGISKNPLWIHGRGYLDGGTGGSEMFYVVSMNWKERGRNYHGYLDDEILLAFGIEDKSSGGIDIRAGDLLTELGLCSEV